MTTLRLEKRGCDFKKNGEEAKISDLTNFRLCGMIKSDLYNAKHQRVSDYFIEICSNIQYNQFRKGMYSFFRNCYYAVDGMCYGDLEKDGLIDNPTKAGILEYINNVFGTHYTDIEIVDRLEDCYNF